MHEGTNRESRDGSVKGHNVKSPEDIACNELVEDITEYLEGEMPASDRLRFEAHVAACPGCRVYLEQMQQTIHTLGTLPRMPLSEHEKKRVLRLFFDWKQSKPT